jgi:hypothetical protein
MAALHAQGMYPTDGSVTILTSDGADILPVASALAVTLFKRGEGFKHADPVRDANAHLIAAAPDLLEAAKVALAQFSDLAAITINGDHDARDAAAINALRAAIQKATSHAE